MRDITTAMRSLERAISTTPPGRAWRAVVANRIEALGKAYMRELERGFGTQDVSLETTPWLEARIRMLRRQQARIADEIDQLHDLARDMHTPREKLRQQVIMTLQHIARYRQRENDLVYDTVALDLGGEQ